MIKVINTKNHESFSVNVNTRQEALDAARDKYTLTPMSRMKVYHEIKAGKMKRI